MISDSLKEKCLKIKVFITDVDGVLTDGGMYYSEHGDELKKFNVRDGVGIILMRLAGIKFGAMTGECNDLVERRFKKLKADFVYKGVKDKDKCLKEFLAQNNYNVEEIAYIGDEINDICLLGKVGVFFTVADANKCILERADHVVKSKGGEGVLREVAEIILTVQDKYELALERFLENSKK